MPDERFIFTRFIDNSRQEHNNDMEQVEHGTITENSEKRYSSPKAKLVFIRTHCLLYESNGNESMTEYDYGNGGFSEE